MCKAILPALKCQIKGTQASMYDMLFHFTMYLSAAKSAPAALEVLLNGGALELTMGHMANAGPDEVEAAVGLLTQFSRHPFGHERMSKKGMLDQLIHCFAKWSFEVRSMPRQYIT